MIIDIQRRLAAAGFDPGKADGVFGKRTESAVVDLLNSYGKLRAFIGSPDPVPPPQPKATRPINEIIIHCTATPEGREVSVEEIRAWHKTRGWSDIGYHHVVHLDGLVEPGRSEALVGAHVAGHNTGTLGIVYVGGCALDGKTAKDTRTAAQKASLTVLCQSLIEKYPAITKISGHNTYTSAKACPSFRVENDPLSSLIH